MFDDIPSDDDEASQGAEAVAYLVTVDDGNGNDTQEVHSLKTGQTRVGRADDAGGLALEGKRSAFVGLTIALYRDSIDKRALRKTTSPSTPSPACE